ncbi:c-type cytochrome [Sapientia aquatica]|jgi:cytochrome c556|uniref:Cytochrome c n=1 Tax=Sapientia aquatica TaxID=1549640 RepID=A0A4R5W228_9BURK|nr:cytochrome c [Sapientia aquatica]TDK66481.1 cytochrome c [Sapientia aquatica]
MKNRVKQFVAPTLIVALFSAAGLVMAQQAPKPETLIKVRQSAFQVVAWNSTRIKASLEGTYNKEDVIKSANAIAAIANSGLGSLFAAGTETGKGWHETSAKAEVFSNGARFAELGANFGKEANELASVALSGDANLVKNQYGKLTSTCKACHNDFKSKD